MKLKTVLTEGGRLTFSLQLYNIPLTVWTDADDIIVPVRSVAIRTMRNAGTWPTPGVVVHPIRVYARRHWPAVSAAYTPTGTQNTKWSSLFVLAYQILYAFRTFKAFNL